MFSNAKFNWLYQSEPEPELNNRKIIQPRGKVLGGSSSINGLLYVRGQREDFDHWRQLATPAGASRTCCRSSGNPRISSAVATSCTAAAAPWRSPTWSRIRCAKLSIKAAEQAGHPRNDDFNGPTQEGAGYYQMTTRNGRRCSTAKGFSPARRRPNLKVVPDALASRVLFEGKNAVGVEYIQGGVLCRARAEGEVILSGGAFNSPQLLQLSGVGPGSLLRQFGIDVVHDMPGVGDDLQDHFQARFNYECSEPITTNDAMATLRGRVGMVLDYTFNRGGPLSIGAGYAGGFFKTDPSLASPDVQIHFILFSADSGRSEAAYVSGLSGIDLPAASAESGPCPHQIR